MQMQIGIYRRWENMRWLVMIAVTDIPASLNHAGDITGLLLLLLLLCRSMKPWNAVHIMSSIGRIA